MWAVVVRIENPPGTWCRLIALRYPEVHARVTQCHARAPDRFMEVVALTGEGWEEAVEAIRKLPGVTDLEVVQRAPDHGTLRLTVPACPLSRAITASGIAPELPFTVAGGEDEWLVITSRDGARRFLEAVEASGTRPRILFAGEHRAPETLSPRQREILAAAVRLGYYDYPRRITLTRLAGELGIAKSTLSQALMIIERETLGALGQGRGHARRPPVAP